MRQNIHITLYTLLLLNPYIIIIHTIPALFNPGSYDMNIIIVYSVFPLNVCTTN